MKLLLLHLSDAHFKDKTYIDNSIIESQVQTLNKIGNNICRYASEDDVDEYSVLLEEIAYEIHFNEKYPLPLADLVKIVDKYNSDHTLSVNFKTFVDVMIKSNILIEKDNTYSFYSNNYLAYFVAKSINSRYGNGEGNGELEEISKNICFNINGDILLFVSYITSNLARRIVQ